MMNAAFFAVAMGLIGPRAWATPIPAPARSVQEAAVAQADAPTNPKPAGAILARGKVKSISRPPKPGSVPYKDAVIAIRLVDVEAPGGKLEPKEILVFAWGMRADKWTAAAGYQPGQVLKLSLQPWDSVADQYGAYNRIELEGDDVFDLEPFWGEPAPAENPNPRR